MITDVPGIEVGHATDEEALTGCTVVICRDGATAGVAVRGAAPGTRETDLCRPGTLIERVHAVLLTGGSAFGLEAAAGVMRHLAAAGIGYDARGIRVPIVPAAVIFDLAVGEPRRPDAAMGERAAADASRKVARGRVGAGTGATIGKLLGPENAMRGGLGTASVRSGDAIVGALAVVNAGGDVVDPATARIVAGTRRPRDRRVGRQRRARARRPRPPAATGREHDARGRRAAASRSPSSRPTTSPASRTTASPARSAPSTRCTTATRSSPSRPARARRSTASTSPIWASSPSRRSSAPCSTRAPIDLRP